MRRLPTLATATVPGSRSYFRTPGLVLGMVMWLMLSAAVFFALAGLDVLLPLRWLMASPLIAWDSLLAYLVARSAWVRMEIEGDRLVCRGWFRTRSYEKGDLRNVYQYQVAIPLAALVSFEFIRVREYWTVQLDTVRHGIISLDSSLATYKNSKRQAAAIRKWLQDD